MIKTQKGFTLIELIVVMAIMSILCAVITPKYITYIDKANNAKAEQVARLIYISAMRSYSNDEKFIKADVAQAVSEDMVTDNLVYTIKDPSDDGNIITGDFITNGKSYTICINGISCSYVLKKK